MTVCFIVQECACVEYPAGRTCKCSHTYNCKQWHSKVVQLACTCNDAEHNPSLDNCPHIVRMTALTAYLIDKIQLCYTTQTCLFWKTFSCGGLKCQSHLLQLFLRSLQHSLDAGANLAVNLVIVSIITHPPRQFFEETARQLDPQRAAILQC